MPRHANLPFHLYVKVDNKFLGENMPDGYTNAIWHSVYGRSNQILACHILLETGAHWSGLPFHALTTKINSKISFSHHLLMPWASMGDEIETFHIKYLEGLECEVFQPFQSFARHTGIMVDWKDGFSRYPQEHKPLNLVELENGQFSFLPNNFLTFNDAHFISDSSKKNLKFYKRNEKIYWGS